MKRFELATVNVRVRAEDDGALTLCKGIYVTIRSLDAAQ